MSHKIFLGLGSNIGDRKKYIEKAVNMLKEKISDITVASLHETQPMYYKEQNKFLNTVLAGTTDLSPEDLLQFTQVVQERTGRIKRFHYGPREIDIDILFYDDLSINSETLKIPHPFMQERRFVLRPLAEIAPHFAHPLLKKSIKTLLESIEIKFII